MYTEVKIAVTEFNIGMYSKYIDLGQYYRILMSSSCLPF